jgi:hypothetical protein
VGGRRQAEYDDSSLRIAKAWERSSPVVLVGVGGALFARYLLAPGNQTRTATTVTDLVSYSLQPWRRAGAAHAARVPSSPSMSAIAIRRLCLTGLLLFAPVGLSACGEVVSTGKFSGENKAVAQTISNFQSDVSTAKESNICQKDLASALKIRLSTARGGCQQAIKNQLGQVDTFTLTIEAVAVNGAAATATVQSTYSGKNATSTLTLVKEGGQWKISGTVGFSELPKKG